METSDTRAPAIKVLKKTLIYVLVLAFFIFMLFVMRDTGSAMVGLLIIIPVAVFLFSLIHTIVNGFTWYFSVFISMLWLLLSFITWKQLVVEYALIFLACGIVGQGLGALIWRLKEKIKRE